MSRMKKTILSGAEMAAEILPVLQSAIGTAKNVADKAEEVGGVNQRGEKPNDGDDFLNDLHLSEQSGREQFSGFGLDPETYDKYEKELIDLYHMPSRATAAKFLQEIAAVASSASTTIQSVWPVATAILSRNVHSPERATAILKTIAKYESQAPGLGLFNIAMQAATGNFNPRALALVRFSLMGVPGSKGNMNDTRDLQQAFDGINLPNSALGDLLNQANIAKQDMQSSQEGALMHAMKYKLVIEKNRNEHLKKIYQYMDEQLPTWVKNNTLGLRTLLEGLSGVVEFNAVKNTALDGLGWKGKTGLGNLPHESTPPLGFVNRGASVERIKKTAQAPGTAPVDYGATPAPATTTTPTAADTTKKQPTNEELTTQNMQQVNKGVTNNVAQAGYEAGVWSMEQANQVNSLQTAITNQKVNVDKNYATLTEMINAGLAGSSHYSQETASSAPYVTPEQMESYAKSADVGASALVSLIQSLLTIFDETSKKIGSANLQQNQVGMVQFSILMRNIEANFRALLKEAQQIRIKIFDISVLGVIDQKVKLLEPRYQELKANKDMMAEFNNVGADVFVMPFASVTQQMAALYFEAASKYKQAAGRIQNEPAMSQYCAQRAQQMQAAGAKARAEGVIALRELMKQQGGGAVASTNSKFVRLAEETSSDSDKNSKKENPCWDNYEMIGTKDKDGKNVPNCVPENKEVEAKPMKVDEYWDKLYHENPPYGDVMVHPEKHRNEPSWKMKSKHHIKRLK